MARQNPDPYLVLGVSPTATQAEITHAYRTRLRAHHPDTRHPAASKTDDDELVLQQLQKQMLSEFARMQANAITVPDIVLGDTYDTLVCV